MMKEIYHVYLKKYQRIHTKPNGNESKSRIVELPWQHVCDVSGLNAIRSFFFPDGIWRHPISKAALSHLFAHDFDNYPYHTCYIIEDKSSLIIDATKLLEGVVYPNCHLSIGNAHFKENIIDGNKTFRKPKDSKDLSKQAESLKIEYPYANISIKVGKKDKDKEVRLRDDFKDRTRKRYRRTQHKHGGCRNAKIKEFDILSLRNELIS